MQNVLLIEFEATDLSISEK